MIRQAQAKSRKAISDYNTAVRGLQRAVDNYNREARAHNARVRANQQRLRSELARLSSQRSTTRYTVTQTSTYTLHTAFRQVEVEADYWDDRGQLLADLAEAETANSARVANTLLGAAVDEELEDTALTDELSAVSADLDQRWRGALFALNPRNPDAARHFCTSSREVIVQMIDIKAPDTAVLAANPGARLPDGRVARREKINYLLAKYGANHASLGNFVETDINDVLNLFKVFNSSTHGEAGKLDMTALRALKVRVEGAVRFLSTVIRGA
ncbi:pPIWI-associating nuclease domain-containing protein [Phytohabitans kaempferiae]|uniref:Predicted pPIWI-associating nuclease domain-containing protein n=1 Tax=Phytohabitans kaempferiae TaxID=1620943 RepID=A0ABV6M6V9_9ACTN